MGETDEQTNLEFFGEFLRVTALLSKVCFYLFDDSLRCFRKIKSITFKERQQASQLYSKQTFRVMVIIKLKRNESPVRVNRILGNMTVKRFFSNIQ